MIANIESLGVRVIGDLDSLADPALAPPTGDNPAPRVSVEVAARFVTGLVRHLDAVPAKAPPQGRVVGPIEDEIRRLRRAGAGSPTGRAPEVGELTTRELLRVVGGGVRGRLARLVSPARSGA